MKKIMALIMLSVFMLAGGCARANQPKAFALPRCHARVVFGEEQVDAVLDFTAQAQKIVLKTKENAFDTTYLFENNTITLRYDTIQTQLRADALPDTNIATLLFKMISAVKAGKGKWKQSEGGFVFAGAVNGTAFSAKCDGAGTLLELEVPAYAFYCKTCK